MLKTGTKGIMLNSANLTGANYNPINLKGFRFLGTKALKIISAFLPILIFQSSLLAQSYFVRGEVREKESGQPLAFTNIRVANTTMGTSSNRNGEYELKLSPGSYDLIASYIGYISDTVSITVNRDTENINFSLSQTNVDLQEIVVLPGENPALEIIRKAIDRKNERNNELKSYDFEAYTKGLIKTQEEIDTRDRSIDLGLGVDDSLELKITGIIENQSKGYFKEPNDYKEIIIARK